MKLVTARKRCSPSSWARSSAWPAAAASCEEDLGQKVGICLDYVEPDDEWPERLARWAWPCGWWRKAQTTPQTARVEAAELSNGRKPLIAEGTNA